MQRPAYTSRPRVDCGGGRGFEAEDSVPVITRGNSSPVETMAQPP